MSNPHERNISLIRVIENLGDTNWDVWECRYEMPDGTFRDGFIQSDGYSHDYETLEDVDGNLVN